MCYNSVYKCYKLFIFIFYLYSSKKKIYIFIFILHYDAHFLMLIYKMNTNHNIRLVKLLMRILETNAPINQTSVSIGFKNGNQNETKIKAKKKLTCKKTLK